MARPDQDRLILREMVLWMSAASEAVDRLVGHRASIRQAFSQRDDPMVAATLVAKVADVMRVDEAITVVLLNRSLAWLAEAHNENLIDTSWTLGSSALARRLKDLRNMHEHCVEYQLHKKGHKQAEYQSALSSSTGSVAQGADGCSYLDGELYLSNRIPLSEVEAALVELSKAHGLASRNRAFNAGAYDA